MTTVLSPTRAVGQSYLSPDDAIHHRSSSRRDRRTSPLGAGANGSGIRSAEGRRLRKETGARSGSRRKGAWKKLLWVKQSYPDNYTDEETFLDHLQRNPRLQPYEFWRLVADLTVIVQHVSSVAIFVCCFSAIFQERVSPITIVGWGSFGAVIGWVCWDFWVGQEDKARKKMKEANRDGEADDTEDEGFASGSMGLSSRYSGEEEAGSRKGSLSGTSTPRLPPLQTESGATTPKAGAGSATPVTELASHPSGASHFAMPPYGVRSSTLSPRNQQRLATLKSAILIYFAVLGLSPILKSLTKSTSSDSIWAMSCWLMCINVFFFDYGGGAGAKFPASLSTNAALMASTVLASRLTSTTHVFSLTLFSIEVFGLFPVFRRHLRHISWRAHAALTTLLVVGASGGVGVTVSGGGWKAALVGTVLGSLITTLAMGICSWWLIDLQKYKNEISGPWDPARPVIRRRWD